MNIVDIGFRSTHYYVLADTRPRLLFDAGWPGMMGAMRHSAQKAGIRLEDIPYQLVSHFHIDHAGLAEELKRLGVRLALLENQPAAIPDMLTFCKPSDHYTAITTKGNIVVAESASRAFLASIGIQGEILATPGHSNDSISLVLDDGIAFTGDLTPLFVVPDDPADLARQSWERLRAKGVTTIYPAHGPSWYL